MTNLTQHHPALAPLATRWATFLDKVRGRVKEIEGEATGAYADVIATDVVDGTALSGVSSALKARLLQLASKVDDSWNTIDGEIDKIDLDDARIVGRFRGSQLQVKAQFAAWLDAETERMIMKGEADAGRALHTVALQEVADRVPCQQCGAMLDRPLWHQSVNVTCPHCKAVTTATPGTASVMFTGGMGAISIAREQAWGAWMAMHEAEFQWRRLRYPTLEDLARWEGANRAYWQAYAEAMGRLHPGWTPEHVANEVTGKMSQFMLTTAKDDRTVRENNGHAVAAIASGDPNQVTAWVARQKDRDDARDTLINAAFERGWGQHAGWVGQILGVSGEDFAELEYYYATRGD